MVDILENLESVKELERMVQDKSIGTLLGAAVGDALGAPVEFMTAQEISEKYGTVKEMRGGGAYNWQCGECTDDTSMMLCSAESLVECGRYNPKDIAKRLVVWYKTSPKDIGSTTKKALSRLSEGVSFIDSGVKEKPTNGSIMRCAPLSLMYSHQEDALVGASMEVSAITHSHIESKLSCVFINAMIARLLSGADKKTAYDDAVRRTREIDSDFVKKYLRSCYKPDPRKGLAVNTLLLATGSFMAARSFEEAVVKAVNLGGDADTTGAVTGALAGAYFGHSSIPERWSSKLNPKSAKHFVKLGKTLFEMEGV